MLRGGVVKGEGGRIGNVWGLGPVWRARTKSWKLGGGCIIGGLGLGKNCPWNACISVFIAWLFIAGLFITGLFMVLFIVGLFIPGLFIAGLFMVLFIAGLFIEEDVGGAVGDGGGLCIITLGGGLMNMPCGGGLMKP